MYISALKKNSQSTAIDHRNSLCYCRKSLSNGKHEYQYPEVKTTITNFNSFEPSKTIFAIICKVIPSVHRLWPSKLLQNLIHCSDSPVRD